MSSAWRMIVRQPGGPDSIERQEIDLPEPGAGEVRIRHEAIGVNFIDTYHRGGLYPLPMPTGLGTEAAGSIEAVGHGVDTNLIGRRVSYMAGQPGTYATHGVVNVDQVYFLPDTISCDQAAALLLKGMTAWMLAEPCGNIRSGQTVLVHAAAGGVGSILIPWLKECGAIVIAHAGTADKAEIARSAGANHALSGGYDSLAPAVRQITEGRGVDAVMDGVGAASWASSLASVARRGLVITYGNASGPVPPVSPLDLLKAGSIFLTRPTVFDYLGDTEERHKAGNRLFDLVAKGIMKARIGQRFALSDAAAAHRALEARATTGSTILIP